MFEHIFKPHDLFRKAKTMCINDSCGTECERARQPDGLKKLKHEDSKETQLSGQGATLV